MATLRDEPFANSLRMVVVSNAQQQAHAFAVRSICFLEDRGLPTTHDFDGNDFHATHLVLYNGDEPIGASRIRWFSGFAKVERTCLRPAYRDPGLKVLGFFGEQMFRHVALKGYSVLLTHAEDRYARLWMRRFGFKRVVGRPVLKPDHDEPYVELIKHLEVPREAITLDSTPNVMSRIEGAWDAPATFG